MHEHGDVKQPHILFISPQPFFEWRGSSIRVKFNVMALSESGYNVDLLTLPIGQDDPSIVARVIRVWNPFNAKKIAIGPSPLKLWFDLLLLIRGFFLVIENKYTVIHGTEEAGSICYLLSLICRAKSVYEKHSDTGSYKNSKSKFKNAFLDVYHWMEKQTIRRASMTIATGPGLSEQAKQSAPNANVVTIPDIPSSTVEPDVHAVNAAREKITNRKNQIVVTYVGSFASYQGIDIIFDCIPDVLKKNTNVKFLIIGGDQTEISYYQNSLNQLDISTSGENQQVMFAGKIAPDLLPAYLVASDILLAPRKSGINSPLKILDYFKAGSAIVATNTVANQRLLNEGTAVLCEFEATSFAESILSLANDSSRRTLLGQNGYKEYQKKYNFSVFKQQLGMAYQTILGNL